jgi:hypothetical protein
MNPCAAAVIAVRPTDEVPSLILSDPPSAKNEATLAAFWLHRAAERKWIPYAIAAVRLSAKLGTWVKTKNIKLLIVVSSTDA